MPDLASEPLSVLVAEDNGYAREVDSQCVVAFDSQDERNDRIIVNRMKNYFFRSAGGHLLTSMVETAFFVKSKVEECIH